MYAKWGEPGQLPGCGQRVVQYLLAERDANGKKRASVRVLRGDPLLVERLIDSIDRKFKYSSGMTSWHINDAPTDEQISQYIDDLEHVIFPGLERDQYAWTVVEHRDADGSVHIHYLVPMVDLRSGRQYNPAPPGWAAMGYDDLRDAWNAREGWARPDDGSHSRLVQPGRYAYVTAEQLRSGIEVEPDANPRESIGAWVLDQISQGKFTCDRSGVTAALSQLGEVTRAGAGYMTLKLPGEPKGLRLKGDLFSEDFSRERLERLQGAGAGGQGGGSGLPAPARRPDPRAAARSRSRLEEALARRAQANREKFGRPAGRRQRTVPGDLQADSPTPALASGHDSDHVPGASAGKRPDLLGHVEERPYGNNESRGSGAGDASSDRGAGGAVLREPGRPKVLPAQPHQVVRRKASDELPHRNRRPARRGRSRSDRVERYPLKPAQRATRARAATRAGAAFRSRQTLNRLLSLQSRALHADAGGQAANLLLAHARLGVGGQRRADPLDRLRRLVSVAGRGLTDHHNTMEKTMTAMQRTLPDQSSAAAAAEAELRQLLRSLPHAQLLELRDAAGAAPAVAGANDPQAEVLERLLRRLVTLIGRMLGLEHAGGFTEAEGQVAREISLRQAVVQHIDDEIAQRAQLKQQPTEEAVKAASSEAGVAMSADGFAARRGERLIAAAKLADQQATAPVVYTIVKQQHDARRPAPAPTEVAAEEDQQSRHPAPRG